MFFYFLKKNKFYLAFLSTTILFNLLYSSKTEDLRFTAEKYFNYALEKARQAKEAKQRWIKEPNINNQNEFNKLRREAIEMFKKFEDMQKAIDSLEYQNFWNTAYQTVSNSINDIGGYISYAATKLFGASDDELFGPNWQLINQQYNAMSEKYKEILKRKEQAKLKPDNEKEIEEIKKEIEIMKKKYEILRQMIRVEQRNLPFLTIFWGEEYMGRYINACVENFDFVSALMNALTLNIKLIYDIVKPAILLKFGDKYIYPKGNLTPEIADAIVLDIMNVGPDKVKTAIDGITSKVVVDPSTEAILKKYEQEMAKNFEKMKDNLMVNVKAKLEKEMGDEVMAYIQAIPYEKLPSGSPSEFGGLVDEYFKRQSVRSKYIQKAQQDLEKQLKNFFEVNKKGYATSKKSLLADKIGTAATIFDFGMEFITLYTNSPLMEEALKAADFQAKKIRTIYREKVKNKEIDPYEITENEYLNSVWNKEWKFNTETGKKESEKIDKSAKETKAQKTTLIETKKNLEKKEEIKQYSVPEGVISEYEKTVKALLEAFKSGILSEQSFIFEEKSAYDLANQNIYITSENNSKVFEAKVNELKARLKDNWDPTLYQPIYKEYDAIRNKVDKISADLYNKRMQFIEENLTYAKQVYEQDFLKIYEKLKEAKKSFDTTTVNYPADNYKNLGELTKELHKEKENYKIQMKNLENYFKDYSLETYYIKLKEVNFNNLVNTVRRIIEKEENIIQIILDANNEADNLADNFSDIFYKILDDFKEKKETKAYWVNYLYAVGQITSSDSVYYQIVNKNLSSDYLKKVISPDKMQDDITKEFSNVISKIEAWRASINVFRSNYDLEKMKDWTYEIIKYEKAIKHYADCQIRFREIFDKKRKYINTKLIKIIKGEQDATFTRDENILANLSKMFTEAISNEYIPPNNIVASWVLEAVKKSPQELIILVEKTLYPDISLEILKNYNYEIEEINDNCQLVAEEIIVGYKTLSKGCPYLDIEVNTNFIFPKEVSDMTIYKEKDYSILAKRLDNLMRGLKDLSFAISKLNEDRQKYKEAVKNWYLEIIKINAEKLPEIEKMLDRKEVKKAAEEFDKIKDSYPPYPAAPEGVGPISETELGIDEKLEEHKKLMNRVYGRLQAMLKAGIDDTSINYENLIKELYREFKQAYESKNASRILSLISDSWTADDGTTLEDLKTNLLNIFSVFNQITCDISNLNILKVSENTYRVSYDITIIGRIYENNLRHEEKSTVVEEVNITKNNTKISKTIKGSYWYIK